MKHIIHSTLAVIARWDDDKFNNFKPHLKRELTAENYSALINMRTDIKADEAQEKRDRHYRAHLSLAAWAGYEDNDIDEWS